MLRSRVSVLMVVSGIVGLLMATIGFAPSASAANVTPNACVVSTTYSTYNRATGFYVTSASSYQVAGPATISYSVAQSASHSFTASASFQFSASAIIAQATATVGVAYQYTNTKSATWTYSTTIPAGKTGIMRVLHRSDKWYFNEYVNKATCTTTTYQGGLVYIPLTDSSPLTYCIIRDFTPYRTGWQSACTGE